MGSVLSTGENRYWEIVVSLGLTPEWSRVLSAQDGPPSILQAAHTQLRGWGELGPANNAQPPYHLAGASGAP